MSLGEELESFLVFFKVERSDLNDTEAGGVDTFLYCPDSKGNVLDMTKHHTRVTFEDARKYVAACEGPVPAPEYSDPHKETRASTCVVPKTFLNPNK